MTEHEHDPDPQVPMVTEQTQGPPEVPETRDATQVQDVPAPHVATTSVEAEEATPDESVAAPASQQEPETLAVPLAELRPALEAVLMVADQPLDQVTLASAVGYPVEEVAAALRDLAEEYAAQGRGFDLRNVAGGWRYYTREEYAAVVEKFVLDGQQARLTQAALETLAVVAYKQPVSRARVSAVRGVNVDGVMRTLLTRGLVEECGHDQETSATLYRTTSYFLERIGITSIDELPELAPFLPELGDLDDIEESMPRTPPATPAASDAASDAAPDAAEGSGPGPSSQGTV
ncbi:MAG TPA: SMC-Scp complex subunit ScpB [Nocardioidaceae bacterium]|nr:SMC-Scp complex subunit ScpB [Nocardioidaceae bacterium]